jgi:hypothetical protein
MRRSAYVPLLVGAVVECATRLTEAVVLVPTSVFSQWERSGAKPGCHPHSGLRFLLNPFPLVGDGVCPVTSRSGVPSAAMMVDPAPRGGLRRGGSFDL